MQLTAPTYHPRHQERLILLWALAETALGGFLHAFKIPLTGMLVGGFAVLTIALLAKYHPAQPWKSILAATTLVLLAKAILSPQSPPTAYIAVAFQGFWGACCFQWLPWRLATVVFGVVAMAESALQKVLVLTLVFGNQFWSAMQQGALALVNWFGFGGQVPALAIILIFTALYALWGLLLGVWLWYLPHLIAAQRALFHPLVQAPVIPDQKPKKGKSLIWRVVAVLSIVVLIAVAQQGTEVWATALQVFLRAVLVTCVLYFVIGPLFRWLLMRWVNRQKAQKGAALQSLLQGLSELPVLLQEIWWRAGVTHQGIGQFKAWVLGLFHWALYCVPKVSVVHGPIRSGKTTRLAAWAEGRTDVSGFLTPDGFDGKRKCMLLDPEKRTELPFEVSEGTAPAIQVGRFWFSEATFASAKRAVQSALQHGQRRILIIDEVGKLELQGQGWEPELAEWIALANADHTQVQLILVVRDELLHAVRERYSLQDVWLLSETDFHEPS